MTALDIQQLVARGEGPSLEFKRRTPEASRLAKEVIAFANTHGGKLILGVDDDGTILGVKDSEEEEFSLERALEKHCRPQVIWTSERVPITRKRDVIVLSVPRSKIKPHYLDGKNGSIVYVRVDDMSIEATRESVRLMRTENSDEGVQFVFGKPELNVMQYLEHCGRISVEQLERLAGISEKESVEILVTLTRARVLVHHREATGDYFTLTFSGEN